MGERSCSRERFERRVELGIDSMMGVEIVAAIERYKIEDAELQEVSTLNKSYDLVKRKIEAVKAATALSSAHAFLAIARFFASPRPRHR